MKKKVFFFILSIMFAFSTLAQSQLKLENNKLLAVFDPANGSLIRLVNKETNWNIINREQLGQSFEMLVPLEERRLHYVSGKEQATPEIQVTDKSIEFTWKSLKSKHLDKALDCTFKGTVTLTDQGLIYNGEVINSDKYSIEYLAWPFLGELTVPDQQKNLICQGRNEIKDLYPRFYSEHGYWGVEYPTNLSLLPENAFHLIRNDDQGIYISSEQAVPTEMLINSFELIPGFDLPGMNPATDKMDGQLVRIQFKVNHVLYTHSKGTSRLNPVKLELYTGSWHKGVDHYKAWKQDLRSKVIPIDWVKQPLNWQKVSISNGNDLISYAKEAQESGVSALSVSGWMRMGTQSYIELVDNFSAALSECKKMNVKIVLEANLTSGDFRSKWYNEILKKGVMTDPFGWPYDRRALCPIDASLTETLEDEYKKHPEILSADGMICDDNNHRGKSFFCFNPDHGHKVPAFTDRATFELDEYFAGLLGRYADNFAVMGYGFYDTQNTYYNAFFINNQVKEQAVNRYINPETPIVSTVDVRTARQDMNLCLKNRYHICYDLRFYNNRLKAYPQIVAYGKQIEVLRKQYKEFIWDGTFTDVLGASVKGDELTYTVYARKSDGKKAIIIVNRSEKETVTTQVSVDNSNNALEMASPENPEAIACNGTVTLQPQSAVIVVEK